MTPRAGAIWIGAVVLAACLPYALAAGPDHDLWWHVKTGMLILEQGRLPQTDPFSFTAEGARWTNHEWLSDVILATAYRLGGDRMLVVLRLLLLFGVTGGLIRLLWNRLPHPLFVLPGILLVTPLIELFVNFRPHGYTYLFTIVLLLLLETANKRPRLLWLLPPMMLVWTNLHGGFLLGLGLISVRFFARFVGLDPPRPDVAESKRLAGILALTFIAPVANPYGPGLFTYLFRELGADHSMILEWQGIWHFPDHRLHFVLLLLVPLVALALGRKRTPAMPLVLLALSALFTYRHGRFLILLVIFSVLVTFSGLAPLLRRRGWIDGTGLLERFRSTGWAFALCALPLVSGLLQFAVDCRKTGLHLRVDAYRVPLEGCEFLQEYDLGPNLLLRFDWGGYAIWHLHPNYLVSADGRNLTVYGADFVDRQIRAYHDGTFAEYATAFDVDVVLIERAGPAYEALRRDKRWVQIHQDRVSAVFVPPTVAPTYRERRFATFTIRPGAERFYFP